MKQINVILVAVMTLDGKITKWESFDTSLHSWVSKEDQLLFASLIRKNKVIIMGRKTYEAAKKQMKHTPGRLRMVMTHHPEKFAKEVIPGQLEFSKESAKELLLRLKHLGHTNVLLASGEEVNTIFLKEHLVQEVWLTLEPKIFGKGNSLLRSEKIAVDLQLITSEQLNKRGTLLLKYTVV